MYNRNYVHVEILASQKYGYLSSIMLNGRKAGLMFLSKKIIETGDDTLRLAITFEGSLNCSSIDFIQLIESHPEIHKVVNLTNEDRDASIQKSLGEDIDDKIKSMSKLKAHASVDDKVIKLVEDKLSDFLGPIAPFLVQSEKSNCLTAGELVTSLAQELKGDEKESFLSLVDLNNTNDLEIESKKSNNDTKVDEPKNAIQEILSTSETSTVKLYSHDIITPESLKVAEDKLSKILGPVSTLLIQSAAKKTKHIGDLFLMLSEELTGPEKDEFLSLVNGVDVRNIEHLSSQM